MAIGENRLEGDDEYTGLGSPGGLGSWASTASRQQSPQTH